MGNALGIGAVLMTCLALMVWWGAPLWRVGLLALVMAAVMLLGWRLRVLGKRRLERAEGLRLALARPWVRVGLALVAFPVMTLWFALFQLVFAGPRGSLLVLVLGQVHMGLMFTGMALMGLAVVRGGKEPRCARCAYLLEGAPEGGYVVCPECGHGLLTEGTIVQGRKRVIWPLLVVGVVVTVAPILGIGTLSRGTALMTRYLPTSSLIKEVSAAPRGFTHEEWAEILRRQLSPTQTERLFEGVLELRERKGFTSREAEGWMDQAALSGGVPANMIERYYEGMLRLWIAAPDAVRRSETPTVRFGFGGDFRGNIHTPASSVLQVWFVPEELFVGEQAAAMEHDPSGPIYGIQMGTADRSFRGVKRDPVNPASDGPIGTVDVQDLAGETIELRGTGWLYVAPHGTPPPPADRSIPVGAVWSKRIDLKKTVRIED
jgi:DNA-directed RNA polymerase subunit RPC12/RpoP